MKEPLGKLANYFSDAEPMAVCFSGGLDSGVLLYAAARFSPKTIALTAVSPLKDPAVIEGASRFAASLGVEHITFATNELDDERFRTDPALRCYICKKILYRRAAAEAVSRGFNLIADGTNLSDLNDVRPGLKAAAELGVVRPFLDMKLGKPEILKIKRDMELRLPESPTTCIATRFLKGEIDERLFPWIRQTESYLRSRGFTGVRVRILNRKILLQVNREQVGLLKKMYQLLEYPTGYKVDIDEKGYRPAGLIINDGG